MRSIGWFSVDCCLYVVEGRHTGTQNKARACDWAVEKGGLRVLEMGQTGTHREKEGRWRKRRMNQIRMALNNHR